MESDKEEELKTDIFEGLYDWLEQITLSRPKKNLARDFSDGLLMAELLKTYFPRLVNLHNYSPANSFENKLKNWIWLNDKVLKHLGLEQDLKILKEVSSVNRRSIENILLDVKNKIYEVNLARKKEISGFHMCQGDENISEVELKTKVSFEEFSLLKETLNDRNEEISILNAKITHLDTLVSLKDQRIDDLVAQLQKCTCRREI